MNILKKSLFYFFLFLIGKNFLIPRQECNWGIISKNMTELYTKIPNIKLNKIIKKNKIYSSTPETNMKIMQVSGNALMGESFEIIKFENGEKIKKSKTYNKKYTKIKHPYYFHEKDGQLCNEFFIKKKDFIKSKNIKKEQKKYLTEPHYYDTFIESNLLNGTLIKTVCVDLEGKEEYLFSGSRFKFEKTEKKDLFLMYCFKNNENYCKIEIKKDNVLLDEEIPNNEKEKRILFIRLLKNWLEMAKLEKGTMPYAWGGTLIGIPLKHLIKLKNKKVKLPEKLIINDEFFSWKDSPEKITGIDCSGLISLAARIAGFNFYLRNSRIQKKYLKKIDLEKQIQDGDILWVPGHVMVLNKTENTIIEATGYQSGYNGVTENPINIRIKNVSFVDDILKLKKQKIPLKILSKNGKEKVFKNFEILSLASCEDIKY